jgi:hypothetical protein
MHCFAFLLYVRTWITSGLYLAGTKTKNLDFKQLGIQQCLIILVNIYDRLHHGSKEMSGLNGKM